MAISGAASSPKGIQAGRAFVSLILDKDGYDAGLQKAQDQLRAFDRQANAVGKSSLGSFRSLAGSLGRIGDALKSQGLRMMRDSGIVLGGFAVALREFMNEGDRLDKMSKRTGVDPTWLSRLQYAAERSGASIDDVEKSVRGLARSLSTTEGAGAAMSLGLDASVLRRIDPGAALAVVLDRLAAVPGSLERARAAMLLFGKSGTALLPLAGSVETLAKEADRLGLSWSRRDVELAARLSDAWTTLWFSLKRVVAVIGGALAPVMVDWAARLSKWASALGKFLDENRGLVRMVASFYALKFAAGSAMYAIGSLLRMPVEAVYAVTGVMGNLAGMPKMLSEAFRDMWRAGKDLGKGILWLAGVPFRMLGSVLKTCVGLLSHRAWKASFAVIRASGATMLAKFLALPGPVIAGWVALGLAIAATAVALYKFTRVGDMVREGFSAVAGAVKSAFSSAVAYVGAVWGDLRARVSAIAPLMKRAFQTAFGGIGAGEWRKSFSLMWHAFSLGALTAFQDAAMGLRALFAYVQEFAVYFGDTWTRNWSAVAYAWDALKAGLSDSWRWLKEDMKMFGIAIKGFALAVGRTFEWVFNGILSYSRLGLGKLDVVFTKFIEGVVLGFKKAFYWSKRILPSYDESDYARDIRDAQLAYDQAVGEAVARREKSRQDMADEMGKDGGLAEIWAGGMAEIASQLDEVKKAGAAADKASDEALRKRREALDRDLAELMRLEDEKLRDIDRQDAGYGKWLRERIAELRKQVATETKELQELVENREAGLYKEWNSYLPDIAGNVRAIASEIGATATFSAQEAAARWGGMGYFRNPLNDAWRRSMAAMAAERAEFRRMVTRDFDLVLRNASSSSSGQDQASVERVLESILVSSDRNGRLFNAYAGNVSQMLQFT